MKMTDIANQLTTATSLQSFAMTVVLAPLLLGGTTPALAEEEFDYAAYFGPFSCEWWGLERVKGSNQCRDPKKNMKDPLKNPLSSAKQEPKKDPPKNPEPPPEPTKEE